MYDHLLTSCQLNTEKKIQRVGAGFSEGEINFAPSYKLLKDSFTYSTKRTSSWTDRIMFRSNQDILQLLNYDSNNLVTASDHRPVFA